MNDYYLKLILRQRENNANKMSFSSLPTEVQLELLSFVSPPDWPSMLRQFVEMAEAQFEVNPRRLEVWGNFRIACDTDLDNWSIRPSVVVERSTWGHGFTYRLGVVAACGPDDSAECLCVTASEEWEKRANFLRDASVLLSFCPRQLVKLPRLYCRLQNVRFDKFGHFVPLELRPFLDLHSFPEWRGAERLLMQIV